MSDPTARQMWQLMEPIHAVTYFAPESRSAATGLGYDDFWMGYLAFRSAPLGPVGADVVTAAFHGFALSRVRNRIPRAWEIAGPAAALGARRTSAAIALRRCWDRWGYGGSVDTLAAAAADLAWPVATGLDCAGRVMAGANRALPRPDDPVEALWQACTTLREHRRDGHIAVLVANGVDPIRAHLLKVASKTTDPSTIRPSRGWTEREWTEAEQTMVSDGLLTVDRSPTPAAKALTGRLEASTDAAAAKPWLVIGAAATTKLADLLSPLWNAVVFSGLIPELNPIGLVTRTHQAPRSRPQSTGEDP